ncbi:hypothetical protein [Isoptericola sediminis]|uniref:hypothetical protein n=1 Tax=Isoptericola sediminis TaxID=2733572 RepID=UPI001C0921C3|nr:hypothetical protein [Isoptericola sediminis]
MSRESSLEPRSSTVEDPAPEPTEDRWERRFAWPVIVAALASVPAVWLTLLSEPYSTIGTVGSLLTGAVLLSETVVLFAVSGDKRQWVRQHRWLVGVTLAVVVSAALAIGPAQLLRLVRAVGALRLLRARHIVRAGRRVMDHSRMDKRWERALTGVIVVVVAAFVAVVLADPTSQSRVLLESLVGGPVYVWIVLTAGLLLSAAIFVLVRARLRDDG